MEGVSAAGTIQRTCSRELPKLSPEWMRKIYGMQPNGRQRLEKGFVTQERHRFAVHVDAESNVVAVDRYPFLEITPRTAPAKSANKQDLTIMIDRDNGSMHVYDNAYPPTLSSARILDLFNAIAALPPDTILEIDADIPQAGATVVKIEGQALTIRPSESDAE